MKQALPQAVHSCRWITWIVEDGDWSVGPRPWEHFQFTQTWVLQIGKLKYFHVANLADSHTVWLLLSVCMHACMHECMHVWICIFGAAIHKYKRNLFVLIFTIFRKTVKLYSWNFLMAASYGIMKVLQISS